MKTALFALFAFGIGMTLLRSMPSGGRQLRGAGDVLGRVATSSVAASEPSATALPAESARVTLGRRFFFEPALSEPPGTSCASCHDPARAYSGNHGSTLGVPLGSRAGHFARRNTPSVMYLRFVPRFHLEWEEEAEYPEAFGGFFWDGRSSSIAELVRQPLMNPDEMGNEDLPALAKKLARLPYAEELRREFEGVFDSPEAATSALGLCLEAFLTSRALSPFSSKYDSYLAKTESLSALESRGLALFQDSSKGACSSCHKLDVDSAMPERSLFTDFGYDTVAAPRNSRLLPNRDPQRFDLGVCERRDPRLHTEDAWFCGAFRTPSLRNVATREAFMHNGVFTSLRDVVRFYATRGTNPATWYAHGTFDDLPERYRPYVNTTTPPYNGGVGDPPALDDGEIDAIVAFLGTLTDRNVPGAPASP